MARRPRRGRALGGKGSRELRRAYGTRVCPLGRAILYLASPTPCPCPCAGKGCLVCSRMAHLLRDGDPAAYRHLLTKALCAVDLRPSAPVPAPPRYSWRSSCKQGQLVVSTIDSILASSTTTTNVLCNGYRQIGDIPMRHILKHSSIFLPVKKGNFLQVTGVPIDAALKKLLPPTNQQPQGFECPIKTAQKKCPNCYPWRLVDVQHDLSGLFPPRNTDGPPNPATCVADNTQKIEAPRKRKRPWAWQRRIKRKQANDQRHALGPTVDNTPSCVLDIIPSPHTGTICFDCLMLDASKCVPVDFLIRRTIFYSTRITKNVFGGKNLSYMRKGTDALALIKHVFGIKECCMKFFHCECDASSTTNSECRYPKLLQQVKNLIRNSRRCQYEKLFKRHCPASSKVAKNEMEAYSTHHQVVSFVLAVLERIIPVPLLGSSSSKRSLRKNIWKFVTLQRYETFQVADCIGELKVSDYSWLLEIGSTGCSCCEPIREAAKVSSCMKEQKRNNLLHCWISWLFSDIVIPLINTYFYVTDRETKGYDIFYYPKSVWRNLTRSAITSMKNKSLVSLDGKSGRELKQLYPPSTVRFLPKAKDVRPIVDFKAQSKDATLSMCQLVIKKVRDENPEMFGSSCFDYDGIHKNLSSFISSLGGQLRELKIYIVVADVSNAFDNVNHGVLQKIMDEVLKGDEYALSKCKKVVYSSSKNEVYRFDSNVSVSNRNNIQDFSIQQSSSGGILVDQGTVSTIRKEELRRVLFEQVRCNILKIGQDFFLQKSGISQGNKLSTHLCSLYYGHLENSVLLKFLEDEKIESGDAAEYLLMRFTGNFVFISSSKKHASNFIKRISRDTEYYKSYMNEKKYGLNFEEEGIEDNRLYKGADDVSFIPWSGLLINCENLEIQADYTSYLGITIKSTITVKTHRNCSMEELSSKLRHYMSPNSHPIFYDSNINSQRTVRLNLYQACMLCAMKFHCYIKSCGYPSSISNPAELLHTVKETCWHMHDLIASRVKGAQLRLSVPPVLELTGQETMWLGLSAFIWILHKKQSRHRDLLALLRTEVRAYGHMDNVDSLRYAVDASHSSVFLKMKY